MLISDKDTLVIYKKLDFIFIPLRNTVKQWLYNQFQLILFVQIRITHDSNKLSTDDRNKLSTDDRNKLSTDERNKLSTDDRNKLSTDPRQEETAD